MSADWPILLLLLFAAGLHASWNALTKSSRDPLLTIWVLSMTGGGIAACLLPFVDFPRREAIPYLVCSVFVHYGYMLLLAFAYRKGDLSQVYPISRGMAPMLVAGLAATFAGEPLGARGMAGVLLVTASIASLALARGGALDVRSIVAALLIGVTIGGYSYIDARGVRASANPYDFILWSFVLDAIPISLTVWLWHGARVREFLRARMWRSIGGGVMATLAYGLVLWAMSRTTMASVSAIRESSVVIAALIGTRLLGEPFGRERIAASCGVAIGILLIVI